MQARGHFFRLPTRDIGVGLGLIRNTAITMAIYTDSGRTVLATVYAAASGGTTKTNPVAQNVGGNNGFEGYLTAGQTYYTRYGSGATAVDDELPVYTDTYPSGLQIGDLNPTGLTIVPDAQGRINVSKDGTLRLRIHTNGSIQAGRPEFMPTSTVLGFAQVNDTQAPNMNIMGVFPTFWLSTQDDSINGRALGLRDTSQGATITMGRTGVNGTTTQFAPVVNNLNLGQILFQGDGSLPAAAEPDFRGTQAAIYCLSTGDFSPTSRPAAMFFHTARPNYMATSVDALPRIRIGDDGGVQLYPQDTPGGPITFSNSRIPANTLTWHNDAGVFKVTTQTGVERKVHLGLTGSKTFDWPSINNGAESSTTVTVTGAVLGDSAVAGMSVDLQGLKISAYVSAANTVTVVLRNDTGGAIDLASATLKAIVFTS